MGLYASIVMVIGKFVREFFSGISHTIMFEELPNVDRILKLCTDIFLVRETGELDLEEDMYAKLIFLYRSPETMIKWTREKSQWDSARTRDLRKAGELSAPHSVMLGVYEPALLVWAAITAIYLQRAHQAAEHKLSLTIYKF